jgi:hypothetical protein
MRGARGTRELGSLAAWPGSRERQQALAGRKPERRSDEAELGPKRGRSRPIGERTGLRAKTKRDRVFYFLFFSFLFLLFQMQFK